MAVILSTGGYSAVSFPQTNTVLVGPPAGTSYIIDTIVFDIYYIAATAAGTYGGHCTLRQGVSNIQIAVMVIYGVAAGAGLQSGIFARRVITFPNGFMLGLNQGMTLVFNNDQNISQLQASVDVYGDTI